MLALVALLPLALSCSTAARRGARPPATDRMRVEADAALDTTSQPRRAIYELWRAYLTEGLADLPPSPYWAREEQNRWPQFDLVGAETYRSPAFRATHHAVVLNIDPAAGDSIADRYVIRSWLDAEGTREDYIVRVYAVRERGGWVLSNSLVQRTRGWRETRVGRIVYVAPPTRPIDRARAERAGAFLDSLADELGAPLPNRLWYVLTPSPGEMRAMIGLEVTRQAFTGKAFYGNRLTLSGAPALGEEYLHELAHFVWPPRSSMRPPNRILVEGIATWAAGRHSGTLPRTMAALATHLRAHPELTFAAIAQATRIDQTPAFYPTGALLCQLAYERGGVRAVRRLLESGPTLAELTETVEKVLGVRRAELDRALRAAAERLASP
ncbi:MAG TPA: hypothetical protein VKA84_00325 [Gemmatimonadaceae bacterium]|nr:hypothetical protein [Gemmatimonadaceae bacterium]